MIEKIYLVLILIFFILAFAVKNIKTYFATKQSIRGKSTKVNLSILLSTIIYIVLLLRIVILDPKWILEIDLSGHPFIKFSGMILVSMGFIMGILSLITMKNSWRVGIQYDQKTTLITTGIYRISRNPYFLSYNILILGFIMIFPSIILAVLYLILIVTFHLMILEEEKYLESVHGNTYLRYKEKVNRYLTLKRSRNEYIRIEKNRHILRDLSRSDHDES